MSDADIDIDLIMGDTDVDIDPTVLSFQATAVIAVCAAVLIGNAFICVLNCCRPTTSTELYLKFILTASVVNMLSAIHSGVLSYLQYNTQMNIKLLLFVLVTVMGNKTTEGASWAVKRPRFLTSFPVSMSKKVDDSVTLACTVDSWPQANIIWYYNHEPLGNRHTQQIKFTDDNQKLHIRYLKLDDAGIYTCIAKNEFGQVEKSCTLVVERNPLVKRPEILQQPENISCFQGDDVVISCISSFSASGGAFCLWQKDGQTFGESDNVEYEREKINDDSMVLKLKISNVQRSDRGKYSLLSMSLFGNISSKESSLIVR
eukprot:gene17252-18977_t